MTAFPWAVPAAARSFLTGAIDYAGLFPPAQLALPSAVGNYLAYRSGPEAWALGRFVVPVARLAELEAALSGSERAAEPIMLSVLLGPGTAADVGVVETFNRRTADHGARIDAVEVRAESADAVRAVLAAISGEWVRYVEVPIQDGNAPALDAVVAKGGFAKLRTGGVSEDAFPTPELLLRTLRELARRKLPFKATAGLHHPLRGFYPLTEAPDAPATTMYGYLNILLAALVLWTDDAPGPALDGLLETDAASLSFEQDGLFWRNFSFDLRAIGAVRTDFFHGFGSCSFREPLDLLPLAGAR